MLWWLLNIIDVSLQQDIECRMSVDMLILSHIVSHRHSVAIHLHRVISKNLSHLIESHSLIISHKTKKKLCRNYGPISVLVRHEEGTRRQEAPFEKPRVLDFSSWASQHAGQISSQHATDPTVTKWMCNCATSRVKPARELQDFKVQMKCEVFLRHLHGFSWRKLEYTLNILLNIC